jgi:hypothetical protein
MEEELIPWGPSKIEGPCVVTHVAPANRRGCRGGRYLASLRAYGIVGGRLLARFLLSTYAKVLFRAVV